MGRRIAFDRPIATLDELEHELRTPLTSILSISELLRDHPDMSESERRRFVDAMVDEGGRLAALIELLLASGRLGAVLSRDAARPAPGRHPA
jgi:signal transduction histidine kinase